MRGARNHGPIDFGLGRDLAGTSPHLSKEGIVDWTGHGRSRPRGFVDGSGWQQVYRLLKGGRLQRQHRPEYPDAVARRRRRRDQTGRRRDFALAPASRSGPHSVHKLP